MKKNTYKNRIKGFFIEPGNRNRVPEDTYFEEEITEEEQILQEDQEGLDDEYLDVEDLKDEGEPS